MEESNKINYSNNKNENLKEPKDDQIKSVKKKPINIFKCGFIWRPVPTIFSTTLCFVISGIIFVIIGTILLSLSSEIKEFVVRYDNITDCENALKSTEDPLHLCTFKINLNDNFKAPVMVYYQLENFYQNHRRYIKSKSRSQLKGEILSVEQLENDCEPIITVADLGINKTLSNKELPPDAPANPCGLIARSLFNDTYSWSIPTSSTFEIYINATGIAWNSDVKGNRYKKPIGGEDWQWTNVEDERFMVWMRPAGLPNFRKLWGRINTDLEQGEYELKINNYYSVSGFNGKKSFVWSTVNGLGGKNTFLGISYIVIGGICLITGIFFWFGYKIYNKDLKVKIN